MITKVATRSNELERMTLLVRDVVNNLEEISKLDCIWKHGVVHSGGPHYRLKGTLGPVSLGEDECLVFGRLIQEFRPANCFIIGNAFGMSSVFIAKVMEACGGRSVITVDSQSEGDGQRCFNTAVQLRERLQARILKNKSGWSPQDIDTAVESDTYDLIFIDGDHSHPQVTRDLHGVLHLVRDDSILCWHDFWMAGVPESVAEAEKLGFRCLKVNSSCEIVFGARSEEVFRRIQTLFANSERPIKRTRLIAYLKLYQALFLGALKTCVFRRT